MENPLALPGQGAPPAYTLPRRACSEVRTISSTNPPTCIQNAMQRERKPFTYTPGGLDLSEIKSERMARRLMRNAMSPGVQETPVSAQTPTSPATATTAHIMNMPVQVFPAFQLPPNPRVLLRTRSTPYNRANSVDRALDFQQYNNGNTFQEDLLSLKVGNLPPLPKKESDSGLRQNILRISESQEDVLNSDQNKSEGVSTTLNFNNEKSEKSIENENGRTVSRQSSQSSLQNGHSREASIDKSIVDSDTNSTKRLSIECVVSETIRNATPSSEHSGNASDATNETTNSKPERKNSLAPSIEEYEVTEVGDNNSSGKHSRESTTTPSADVKNSGRVKKSSSGSSQSIRESTPRSEAGSESQALIKSESEYSVQSERESTPKSETSASTRNDENKYESENSISSSKRHSITRSNSNVAATESIRKSTSFQSANSSRKNSLTRSESSVERKIVSVSKTESGSSVNRASSVFSEKGSEKSRTISVEREQNLDTNLRKHSTPIKGSNETLTDKDIITSKTRKLSTPMRELQPDENQPTGVDSKAEDKPSTFKVDPSLKETLEKLEQNLTEMTKTFKESMSKAPQTDHDKTVDVTTEQQTEVIRSSPEKPRHSLLLQRLSVERTYSNKQDDTPNIDQSIPYNVHTNVTSQTTYNKSLEYKDGKQSTASWNYAQNTAPDNTELLRPFTNIENPSTSAAHVSESAEEPFETKNVKEHINVFNQTTEPPHWINTFKKNGAISPSPLYRPSHKPNESSAVEPQVQTTWINNNISQGEPPVYLSTDRDVVPPAPPLPPAQIPFQSLPLPVQPIPPLIQSEPEPSYSALPFQSAPALHQPGPYHSTPAPFHSVSAPAPFQSTPAPTFYNNSQTTQPAFYNTNDKGFSRVVPPTQESPKLAYVPSQSDSFMHTYAPTHPQPQTYDPPFVQSQYQDNERHAFVPTQSLQPSLYGSRKPQPFRPNLIASQQQVPPRENFQPETGQLNLNVYYDDEIEPKEVIEPPWRRELREFVEKSSQPPSQRVEEEPVVEPPWMKEVKLRQNKSIRPMPHINAPVPEPWSPTIRPKSWRERSVDIEQHRQNELPDWQKPNTYNKRPISAFIRTHLEAPIMDRTRGVSMDRDRFTSNYHSASSYTSSPSNGYSLPWESSPERSPMLSPTPLQYDRIRSAPQSRSSPFRQPASHPPQGYNQSSGPREYGTLSYQPRLRDDCRTCPVQSRSFKYLQRLTGTDDGYEDNEPFVAQPPMHSQPRPQRL